jgi:hypothetical protein
VGALRKLSRLRFATVLVAALAILPASGCGSEEEKTAGAEGEYINAGDAVYQVQLTRLLNPEQRPDNDLARGQAPLLRGEQFLAVFLVLENEGDAPYVPPRDMTLIDTVGNEYLPLDTTQSAGFGLDFGAPLGPGGEAPPPDSPAAQGPDRGAMVLFRVKEESATENLPLVLEIPSGGKEPAEVELDI